jgi:Domain of unknown function (DUF4340)
MKLRTTLILFVIVVGLVLFIKYYESKRPGTEEAERRAQNVLNFDRDKLEGIVIQNGDDRIELRRQDNKWRLEGPIKDQADNGAVDTLVSNLEFWQKDNTIPSKEIEKEKGGLAEYGLSKPKLRLQLLGKEMPPEILFGKEAALEGRMYVRFGNARDVFIAAQSVRNDIAKKPEDFRDRKLTELTTAQVERVLLKTLAGEIELQKKNEHWQIVKPLRARGDDQKIADLIAQVTTARIEKFVADDRGDLRPYGLAEPRGSITLFGEGKNNQGQMLQIGSVPEKEQNEVYVRFAARNGVYTLPKKIETILATKPDDLRDRHLVRFETNILDRITIDAPGRAKTVLARKDQTWSIVNRNNQPANAEEVSRLIETLQTEQVTRFVADVASDLAKYGLDKPQLVVTLSSFASENTAETKAGEEPFATIAFGQVEGNEVYARLGDEPFVVAVQRSLLDNIPADPLQWQSVGIFEYKPEQVHRLGVVTDHEDVFVRGAHKQWQLLKGAGEVNQVHMKSLLNTLTTLRAVRWAGAAAAEHQFEKPQLVITFTTSPDDKAQHKLTVGASNNEGMWFARTEEKQGTFLLSQPDLEALRLPLMKQPSPSPSASPSPAVSASPVVSPAPTASATP